MKSRSKIDMLRHFAYRLLRAFATLDETAEHRQIAGLRKRVEALEELQALVRLDPDVAVESGQPPIRYRAAFHVTGEAHHALR